MSHHQPGVVVATLKRFYLSNADYIKKPKKRLGFFVRLVAYPPYANKMRVRRNIIIK
jgi:hypothetical protein